MKRMRRVLATLFCVSLLFTGCIERETAQKGDFNLLSNLKNGKIMLGANEGSTATIEISAKYDWEAIESKGFVCTPSSGPATESTTIEIRALRDNNSADTLLLGNLHFRLLSTRFVGLSVYQLPRMIVDKDKVVLSGAKGATNYIYVDTDSEFEIKYDNNALFSAVADNENGCIAVTALEDNDSEKDLKLGEITISLVDAPACKAVVEVYQRLDDTPQTVIYYFLGTLLNYYYDTNIEAAMKALDNDIMGRSRVVILQQTSTTDAVLYEVRYDAKLKCAVKEVVKNIQLTVPYDAALLTSVLGEIVAHAPAKKYGLIMGSHGKAWLPKDVSTATKRLLTNMGLSYELIWQKREGAQPTRHIGDSSKTQYNMSEIAEAIQKSGITVDYILFDSCFMGNVESAYDLRNVTKYIIGSPCEVMAWGFPYEQVLPALLKDGGRSYDLDAVCRAYVDFAKEQSTPSGCVSLTTTAELENLAVAMKAVNGAERNPDFSLDAVQSYEGLSSHVFYDLEDYVIQSCADTAAVEAFKAQLAKTVTSRYHTAEFFSEFGAVEMLPIFYYSGISTSADVKKFESDWQQTAWYKATH